MQFQSKDESKWSHTIPWSELVHWEKLKGEKAACDERNECVKNVCFPELCASIADLISTWSRSNEKCESHAKAMRKLVNQHEWPVPVPVPSSCLPRCSENQRAASWAQSWECSKVFSVALKKFKPNLLLSKFLASFCDSQCKQCRSYQIIIHHSAYLVS